MTDPMSAITLIVCGLILLGGYLYEDGLLRLANWLDPPDPDPSPIDEVNQAYYEDRIDEDEMERRLEVLVDDRARTIRDKSDKADGIGEELSRELAREFDTVADLKAADIDDLRAIDGIGEMKAERLHETLS